MTLSLGTELAFLLRQRMVALFEFPAPSVVFGQWDDAVQVGIRQTVQLVDQTGATFAQVLATGLQFLRQPMAPMGSLQGLGKFDRVAQHFTQIAPHQLIELPSRRKA